MNPKIGVELITWGRDGKFYPESDQLPKVLDEVLSLGYDGVETLVDAFGDISDPKELLSNKSLSLAGLHMLLEGLREKQVDAALDLLRKTDSHYLLFSFAGEKENTEEKYLKNARRLERIGKKATRQGARVCYHNHWQELINDMNGMKIICTETSPEYVSIAADTYWIEAGGSSPAEYIKENLDRIAYLHLKDGTEEELKKHEFPATELGQGIVDFEEIYEALRSREIEWFVVEQDYTKRTPKESMAINRKYLKEKLRL